MRDHTFETEEQILQFIRNSLKPLKNVPLKLIIKALSGYDVEPFNYSDERDLNLLENLKHVATLAGETINKEGICRTRANEVGNDIEKFVKAALIDVGYNVK